MLADLTDVEEKKTLIFNRIVSTCDCIVMNVLFLFQNCFGFLQSQYLNTFCYLCSFTFSFSATRNLIL